MKQIILLVLSLTAGKVMSQDFTDSARKAQRNNRHLDASLYAAKALQQPLKSRDINRMRETIDETYNEGIELAEKDIKYYNGLSTEYRDDSTIIYKEKEIDRYQKLINLNTEISRIPPNIIGAQGKKDKPLVLAIKDYTEQLREQQMAMKALRSNGAAVHYQKGMQLNNDKSLQGQMKAFDELQKAVHLEAGFKNSEVEMEKLRKSIAVSAIQQTKINPAANIEELIKIRDLLLKARLYAPAELSPQLSKCNEAILKIYESLAIGFINTAKQRNPIDNSYAALDVINKIKNIDTAFKNTDLLQTQALKGTLLIDSRDRKTYTTEKIGKRIWMTQNLDYMVPGAEYSYYTSKGNQIVEEDYGLHYSHRMITGGNIREGSQGICPPGWHVPSKIEFEELVDSIFNNNRINAMMKWQLAGTDQFNPLIPGFDTKWNRFNVSKSGIYASSTVSKVNPKFFTYLNVNDTNGYGLRRYAGHLGILQWTDQTKEDLLISCRCLKDAYTPENIPK